MPTFSTAIVELPDSVRDHPAGWLQEARWSLNAAETRKLWSRPRLPLVPFLPSPHIAPAEMTASLPGHDIMLSVWATPASRGSATLTALHPDPPQAATVMAGYIGLLPPWLLPSHRAASEGGFLRVSIPQQVACVSRDLLDVCQWVEGLQTRPLVSEAPVVGLADLLGPQDRTKWSNPGGTTCVEAIFSLPVASCIMVAGGKPMPLAQVGKEMLLTYFFNAFD